VRSYSEALPVLARLPRSLLRLEGLAVLAGALALYFDAGYGWVLLAVLGLAPDLSMVGYLGGPAVGALAYDVVHTYALPIALGVAGVFVDSALALQLALIWLAHIGADRALGYGLKYPTRFQDTHLQRV
jgi:Domain of unknown function (DUF4260)